MSIHAITVCFSEPDILAWSLMKFKRTTCIQPKSWMFLDNCWPLNRHHTSECIELAAKLAPNSSVIKAEKNLGGHGGYNFALAASEYAPDDYLLTYDPDSNPLTPKWLEAMRDVLDADPTMAYVSLLDRRNVDRPWTYEQIGGHKVAFLPYPEMWAITLFRKSILDKGIQADSEKWNSPFYGHVEPPMFRHARERGQRNGYLFDFRDDKCPIEPPKAYTKWKQEHAYGKYPGNFDAYCIEMGIK